MTRNGFPHHLLDPERDHDAAELIARYSPSSGDWPLVVVADGTVLRNPGETELARALGMIGGPAGNKIYNSAIVGCGPAGLATAVYAASEGLAVVVLDARSFGGLEDFVVDLVREDDQVMLARDLDELAQEIARDRARRSGCSG